MTFTCNIRMRYEIMAVVEGGGSLSVLDPPFERLSFF